ncbi:MAG: hypothetical protein KFW09_02355 [Oscillospiraceae bacterium]|nr:hypothetical protein [Oscillospiraceae bacterium]
MFIYLNPTISYIYFIFIILSIILINHPIYILISFLGAIFTFIKIETKKNIIIKFKKILFIFIFISLVNPIFVHKGLTILFYIKDKPITLESILYGINNSLMISSLFTWFDILNKIVSSDKIVYIFKKYIPSSVLIFSICLNLIPQLKDKYKQIEEAHLVSCNKNLFSKIKISLNFVAIIISWQLEKSIETAYAMNSRGYENKKKSIFKKYNFKKIDFIFIFIIFFLTSFFIIGYKPFSFYPIIFFQYNRILSPISYIFFLILCFLPIFFYKKEIENGNNKI